ncbi:hypothetical protein TSUD_229330 [Trifolium subterraneum]|uniref:Uncharacterized protein n=1 Tax=Trifolium subterraneum TaxID=3900 RepID=A0A2Z6M9Z7_TRISU|nr:hypothetical protein TSUD_229330 [Trifolium subterraneum]
MQSGLYRWEMRLHVLDSIDLGDPFAKLVLIPIEAEIALGLIPAGWWEKTQVQKHGCEDVTGCNKGNCFSNSSCGDAKGTNGFGGDYLMDYYAQDEIPLM